MSSVLKRKSATVSTVMNSKPFNEGYKDAINNLPYAYDKYSEHAEALAYEWGRLFAQCYNGPIKIDRRLSEKALWHMYHLMRNGIII